MLDFVTLAHQCAPSVEPSTLTALLKVESNYNPFAIGVVAGHLERQPETKEEAIATAKALKESGWNFSLGMGQINVYNLESFKISFEQAFDACESLKLTEKILTDCFARASAKFPSNDAALKASFSCYYSGNFERGFQPEGKAGKSYVQKVMEGFSKPPIPVVAEGQPIKIISDKKFTVPKPDQVPEAVEAAIVQSGAARSWVAKGYDGYADDGAEGAGDFDGFAQ